MNRLKNLALAAACVVANSTNAIAANLLLNPGFETDAVLDAEPSPFVTDWSAFNGATTASANLDPVRTGIGSLLLPGPGGFFVPGAFQTFPANPGEIWDLQGYMLTPNALPTDITFGLLKIVFGDGDMDLPPGPILIGQAGPAANPGVESLPLLNSASTPNTWQFTQARGVAPAGTIEVRIFALFVPQSAGTGYFDDLEATLVPADPDLPGDYNENDTVDAADYTVWRNNLGSATALPNDSSDGVGQDDYERWKTNFGMTSPGASAGGLGASAVPEPATLLLAIAILLSGVVLHRQKR